MKRKTTKVDPLTKAIEALEATPQETIADAARTFCSAFTSAIVKNSKEAKGKQVKKAAGKRVTVAFNHIDDLGVLASLMGAVKKKGKDDRNLFIDIIIEAVKKKIGVDFNAGEGGDYDNGDVLFRDMILTKKQIKALKDIGFCVELAWDEEDE